MPDPTPTPTPERTGPWLMKVRKVGNSPVVTLPKELEAEGWKPGRKVLLAGHRGEIKAMLLRENALGPD